MATTHSAPIDLYAEAFEELRETQDQDHRPRPEHAHPQFNGDVDRPAVETSRDGLERVLGW